MRKTGLAALLAAATLPCLLLWITDLVVWQNAPLGFTALYAIRLALIALLVIAVFVGFQKGVVQANLSRLARRCAAACFASALTLILLEVVFMFVPHSHNVGHTLGSMVWFRYHWRPLNSRKYRDAEHVPVPGKKLVFVVGDSFTAGGGLPKVESRFANRLGALHPELHVLNLGKNGSDTIDEYRRLVEHPQKPDLLILQYYPNDIEGAAVRAGWHMPAFTAYEDLGSVARLLVRNSFLLNFVYWQFPHEDGAAYLQFLEKALTDPPLLQQHLDDLAQFCTYATGHAIPLFVVMFPLLEDLEDSVVMTTRVKALFADRHVPIVDVADLVKDMPLAERMVNSQDAHASARVNELVAEALARLLEAK